jgi:hypothetical protein
LVTLGNAVFVWQRTDGTNVRIQARTRSATGVGPIRAISGTTQSGAPYGPPQLALDAAGSAVFVWSQFDGKNYRAKTRTLSATGILSPVQTLSAAGKDALNPQLAIDPAGNATFVWRLRPHP